jgi:prophage regulatory protein
MTIYRLPQVKEYTGHRSSATIYGAIREGLFVRPIRIGARAVGFPDYEISAIVNARIAGKSKEQIKALVDKLHSERAHAGEATTAGV